jgi:hypothetical protein
VGEGEEKDAVRGTATNSASFSILPFGSLKCGENYYSNFNFPPAALGSNVITYTFILHDRDIEIMFVNAQINEVYYFYHDGNMH